MNAFPYTATLLIAGLFCGLAGAAELGQQRQSAAAVSGHGGPPPTLSEVAALTYQRYPEQPLAASRRDYAAALTRQAHSAIAGNPALTARYQTDQVGSDIGLREWEAGVELPLWRPGQRGVRQQLGERTGGSADAAAHALRLEVAGKVRETVWEVFTARNNLALAEHEWQAAQSLEQDVRKRVSLGELAKTDLLLAQDETYSKRDLYLSAQAEVAHAEQRYEALTGLQRMPRRKAESQSTATSLPEDHPLLVYLRAELERSRAQVMVARRERAESPQALFGVRQEKSGFGADPVNSVGVTVRWPLATNVQSAPRIRAAQMEVTQAQADLLASQRRLQVDFHEAQHELGVLAQRLVAAQQKATVARESLRLARLSFSLGESDLVSRLRVQSLAFAAERAEQELQLRLQAAIARYNQSVGELP